jgi:hypothetical protein
MARIAREAGEVLDSPGFRSWYETSRCEGSPAFPHFWAYVQASLSYDVPGRELCGLVWEATTTAFEKFDASRGDPETPIEARFLKHWRVHLDNLAKKTLRRGFFTVPLPPDLAGPVIDPFLVLLKVLVRGLVEGLPEDERRLIKKRYWDERPFGEIARMLKKRKQTLIDRHNVIIGRLARSL